MSRHKPSPFEFPRAPLSPPDTNADIIGPTHMPSSTSLVGHELRASEAEPSPAYSAPTPESAAARFRKISSIAYHTSGLRESRERTPQRGSKVFVIIIPPTSFTQEHGQLGNTLSSGPRHRLSQGMLMPLFPTMYGQLTAIAREFNFPSTTGLCLYPHFVENGVTMTPRISDESWPFIWSHVFEASPAPRSPISGKIEFDIDMRQARWYASWMASSHRDYVDHPFSANPSVAPSATHERGDSKTTFQDVDDQEESRYVAPTTRHVPRKLSLVDRYDMMSVRSGSRPASRSALSPPEQAQVSAQVLSPIFQEEEPKSAKHDLDSRVKTWRASAVLKPTPFAATGQTSLEPANMPNTMPIEDTIIDTLDDELNLADFAWSVSSAGPNDYDPMSPMSWDRVPSVHIADRMQGSVCLTPSDCTSFGPSDYTLPSPAPSIYRLPSPDIAHRMFEDVPPTPSTATSWGAPFELPPTPFAFSRAPSVDLGQRLVFSRPVTPTTATSWGPASWPASPVNSEYSRPRSIHLGDRGEYSRPVTPSTATSWGAPLSYPPSPTTPFHVSTPDAGHRGFEDTGIEPVRTHAPWGHAWPTASEPPRPQFVSAAETSVHQTGPWAFSWPYRANAQRSGEALSVRAPSAYPRLVLYQPVYPHFDLYPAVVLAKENSPSYPSFDVYPALPLNVTPRHISVPSQPIVVKLTTCYPAFDLYPAVYPGSVYGIYPPVTVNESPAVFENVASRYPFFDLYPAVYPHVVPYPQALEVLALDSEPKQGTQGYPDFALYPALPVSEGKVTSNRRFAGYPDFIIYPQIGPNRALLTSGLSPVSIKVKARYPYFNLYPAVYPNFDLYLALDGGHDRETAPVRPMAKFGYPQVVTKPKELSTRLAAYPVLDLYPAVYPAFNIYPSVERATVVNETTSAKSGYAHLKFYLALSSEKASARRSLSTRASWSYPIFNIYPAVYPFIEVYPTLPRTSNDPKPMTSGYPYFNVYPPSGYPHFDLYPALHASSAVSRVDPPLNVVSTLHYPIFNLYPAVYPYFDLYPTVAGKASKAFKAKVESATIITVKVTAQYPAFDLYSAVYPYLELWPAMDQPRIAPIPAPLPKPSSKLSTRSTQSRLTHSELHAMVMMERIGSSGSFRSIESLRDTPSKAVKTHDDSHHAIFSSGAVTTPSGTRDTRSSELDFTNKSFADELLARRRVSTLRQSTRLPLPTSPSPSRRLPPPPRSHGARLSSAFESIPTRDFEEESPTRVSASRRTPASRFPQDEEPRQRLTRSTSLMKPFSSVPELNDKLSRSNSLTSASKPSPRRRDSIVSQRVRAYNSSQDGIQLSMDTLSKFPAPPMPPVSRAPVPKALDHSKYPFKR
ncbi:hypothetical protein D9615_000440 [Tricholomella constricta]|uniref:Uncharacterized protein n=1 Tax=Tricholomella constricta TaxID=117010 RepID=A0A8H5MB96_9AGAR|nr:hypothetical protein D9615_000440 [Tricholomella constricta]